MLHTAKSRIAILDDDKDIAELIVGYVAVDCELFYCPHDLIPIANTFDAIICDYIMPGMNGEEFACLIRAAGYKGLLVCATGYPDNYFDLATFDNTVSKPFSPDAVEKLRSIGSTYGPTSAD